jgi:hypothetical protein
MRQILLAAAAVSLLAAGQASAHARLLKSSPAKGATVAAPKALTLTFSEEIVAAKSSVAVTAAGKPAATGPISLDKTKKVVTVPVTGALAPGAYKVDWKMTTEDTHTMTGTFGFKVK